MHWLLESIRLYCYTIALAIDCTFTALLVDMPITGSPSSYVMKEVTWLPLKKWWNNSDIAMILNCVGWSGDKIIPTRPHVCLQ